MQPVEHILVCYLGTKDCSYLIIVQFESQVQGTLLFVVVEVEMKLDH
jgi:hypothetical protein